jgi:hypothetical protein
LGRTINYDDARKILEKTFEEAEEDRQKDLIVTVPKIIQVSTKVLFASNTQAFREALVGCLLAKLLNPRIDITRPYMNQGEDAFNGRTLDEKVVNPFLHEKEIPCSRGPYLAALRRSVSFVPETQKGVRDKEAFSALLSFITEAASAKKKDAESFLLFLLSHFIELREKSNVSLAKINRLSVDQYGDLIEALLGTPSGGLLPVLLTVATLEAVKITYDLPWHLHSQGINVADAASGAGGDVTIMRERKVLLAIEVTERAVSEDRVRSTFRTKILPNKLDDYIFLFSGGKPAEEAIAALGGVTQDPAVLSLRPPPARHLQQELSSNMSRPASAPGASMAAGDAAAACGAAVAHRARFGVPPQIVVAIWGLETDFGKGDMGKLPVIRVLATLAHDCRRTELFQGELLAALKIVQRGDLPLARPDRRLCRRDRPDAVPAVVLHQIRRRFRRRRPCRSAPQRARRARLHRQPAAHQRLQDGRALRRGHREFRGDARVEQGDDLSQDHRVFRRSAGGAVGHSGARLFARARNP